MSQNHGGVAATLLCLGLLLSPSAMPLLSAASAEDFYQTPVELPDENGALIRQERIRPAPLEVVGQVFLRNAVGTRIMYRSTDDQGQPVAVTGTYIEPATPWPGPGYRPLVSYAVGTQGVGDSCAPSKTLGSGLSVDNGSVALNYELPFIEGFLRRGMAVVVSDYVGLGTADRLHAYLNRADLGHSVLDAARAALAVSGSSVTAASPIGLFGYSQGGSATGAAAELAATYAPELNIRAAYVGAPASTLPEVLQTLDGSLIAGVIAWEINGLFPYHPELQAQVAEILNSRGQDWLAAAKDQCVVDAVFLDGFQHTAAFTRTGKALFDVIQAYPDILAALEEQRLGKVAPSFPVLVISGTQDDLVKHQQARQVAVDWCRLGSNVSYWPSDQLVSSQGLGVNHVLPMPLEYPGAQGWLIERLEGEPVQTNCESIDGLP